MDNPFEILIQQNAEIIRHLMDLKASGILPLPATVTQANDETLVTADDVATHLNKSIQTVWRMAKSNVIPFYKPGRTYMFKLSEVDRAISSQTPIKRKSKGGNNGS
jgi:excisionase family DNA binding protein